MLLSHLLLGHLLSLLRRTPGNAIRRRGDAGKVVVATRHLLLWGHLRVAAGAIAVRHSVGHLVRLRRRLKVQNVVVEVNARALRLHCEARWGEGKRRRGRNVATSIFS